MNVIVLGNMIGLIGSVIMVLSGYLKKKNAMLGSQCLMYLFYATGNFILGGITGGAVNLVNCARNFYALKAEVTAKVIAAVLFLQALLTLLLNREGLIGWMPFASSVLMTISLHSKNEVILKLGFISCQVFFAIYDFSIKNYQALFFEAATVISSIIGIFRILKDRKQSKNESHS